MFNNETDPSKVSEYTARSSETSPPIIVDGEMIADGDHRAEAAIQRGETSILAYVIDYPGDTDDQPHSQGAGSDSTAAGSVRDAGSIRGGAGVLASEAGTELGLDQPLTGAPESLTVPERGKVAVGPHAPARQAAANYMRRHGLTYQPATSYAKVDPARAARIANAFEEMEHQPNDPHVAAAYEAMIAETLAQFDEIRKTGLRIEFIDNGQEDPYAAVSSPCHARRYREQSPMGLSDRWRFRPRRGEKFTNAAGHRHHRRWPPPARKRCLSHRP
jgi:hypothetical protein